MQAIDNSFLLKMDRVQLKSVLRGMGEIQPKQLKVPTAQLRQLLSNVVRQRSKQHPELFQKGQSLNRRRAMGIVSTLTGAAVATGLVYIAGASGNVFASIQNMAIAATEHGDWAKHAFRAGGAIRMANLVVPEASKGTFGETAAQVSQDATQVFKDTLGETAPRLVGNVVQTAGGVAGSLYGLSSSAGAGLWVAQLIHDPVSWAGTVLEMFGFTAGVSGGTLVLLAALGPLAYSVIGTLTGRSENESHRLVDQLLKTWGAVRPAYTKELQLVWKTRYSEPCKVIKRPIPCAAKRISVGRFRRSEQMCTWDADRCRPSDEMKLKFKPGK